MTVRIGFGAWASFHPQDPGVRDLLALHRYWGGPLEGLHRTKERMRLYMRTANVRTMLETQDVYTWRAPRRWGRR